MTIPVLYCHMDYDTPHTGGEWAHYYTVKYLAGCPEFSLQKLDACYTAALKRPGFRTQLWFLKRFWGLPAKAIIVQASESYLQLFLANCILKLRRCRPQVLILVHSDPYLKSMNWKGRLIDGVFFKLHVCLADRLVANSRDMCQRLIRMGVNRQKIALVTPAAQDLPPPKKMEKLSGVFQIICPANIYPKKGQEVLIEAMRRINDDHVTALLPGLVKDPMYDLRIRTLVKQYGLDHRISFTGYLHGQEMADAYAQSSICVIPSLHEPYGMVVQEAMHFGLPIIASKIGGLTEQINDGVDGFLVLPGDPDVLARAIQRVVNDSNLRERLVENAKEKAKTFPAWESVMQRTCAVIREMAKEK